MEIIGYEKYVDILHKEFPELQKKSIAQILMYGTNKILHYRRHNIDLYLRDDKNLKYYMYIGDIIKDPYKRNYLYFKKKRKKLRHMSVLDKIPYTGYYYFGLTEESNTKFKETGIIDMTIYYKLEEEVYLNSTLKHCYKVKMEDINKWRIIRENYEERNAEYIQRRNDKGSKSSNNS